MAAETGDVAAGLRRAYRQRVLCGREVAAGAKGAVASGNDIELPVLPNRGVQLAFANAAAFPIGVGLAKAHVHQQRFCRHRFRAAGTGLGKEIHAATEPCRRGAALQAKHFGKTDVAYAGCHAGKSRFGAAVAGDRAGDVGAVADHVDPKILILDTPGPLAAADEVAAANAASIGGDVHVVDVQAGVHDADGDLAAVVAGEKATDVIKEAHRIGAHGWHDGIVGCLNAPDRFHGLNEIGGKDGVQRLVRNVGNVDANRRVEVTHRRT